MNVKELRSILEDLRSIYADGGAVGQARDVDKIIAILKGREGQSVDDFLAETRALLTLKASTGSTRPSQYDKRDADKYAAALLEAGTDQSKFDAVFSSLQTDPKLARPTLDVIANQYVNTPSGGTYQIKFRSKTDAIETIRKKFIERAQSESKKRIIDRLTRW